MGRPQMVQRPEVLFHRWWGPSGSDPAVGPRVVPLDRRPEVSLRYRSGPSGSDPAVEPPRPRHQGPSGTNLAVHRIPPIRWGLLASGCDRAVSSRRPMVRGRCGRKGQRGRMMGPDSSGRWRGSGLRRRKAVPSGCGRNGLFASYSHPLARPSEGLIRW